MAQRPPRMPRRPKPDPSQDQRPHSRPGAHREAPVHSAKVVKLPQEAVKRLDAELPTDAIEVIAPRRAKHTAAQSLQNPAPQPARHRTPKPKAAAERAEADSRPPLRERAKQKQSQRRMVDRAKFSAAVRRKPGEVAPPKTAEPEHVGEPVAAHRFSGRVAALLVVLAFFAVMLVPTINHYRNQMHEINELRQSISAMEAERDSLKEEIARWDDPLYIKQQARDRINLVMPGERVYMVVGEQPSSDDAQPANGSTYEVRQELPWVDALLDSMRRAATD